MGVDIAEIITSYLNLTDSQIWDLDYVEIKGKDYGRWAYSIDYSKLRQEFVNELKELFATKTYTEADLVCKNGEEPPVQNDNDSDAGLKENIKVSLNSLRDDTYNDTSPVSMFDTCINKAKEKFTTFIVEIKNVLNDYLNNEKVSNAIAELENLYTFKDVEFPDRGEPTIYNAIKFINIVSSGDRELFRFSISYAEIKNELINLIEP